MKKIIFILALFVSFVANAQYTPPTGYTNINSRYDWLAGVFRALGLPAGGNAAFTTGQAQRAGSVYYDSTGVDAGLYVWSGSAWVGVQYTDADARAAISLTTTGTSGAATYSSSTGVLNIPVYATPTPTLQQVLVAGSNISAYDVVISGGVTDEWTQTMQRLKWEAYSGGGDRGKLVLRSNAQMIGYGGTAGADPSYGFKADQSGSPYVDITGPSGEVRMSNLPAGVGTKSVRIDPSTGKLTYADTTENPNLIVQTAGAGEPTWYTSGDTLYLKSINDATTEPDSSLTITSVGGMTNPMTDIGDIIQGTTAGAPSKLASVATGNALISGGVTTANSWGKIGLTTHVSGILPIANGGTNSATQNWVDLTTTQSSIAGNKTWTGAMFLTGGMLSSTSSTISNFSVPSATTGSTTTQAEFLSRGAAAASFRVGMRGSTNYQLSANQTHSHLIQGIQASTEASSGTHGGYFGVQLLQPSLTNGGAATLDASSFHIVGPPTGTATITNGATSMWVGSGISRFGETGVASGILRLDGITSGFVTVQPAAAAGTWTMTLPTTAGTDGYVLKTNGSGVTDWVAPTKPTLTRNMTMESPTASENYELIETPVAITITEVKVVLVGSGSPSVTYNLAFDADRSVAGTNVFTAGQTVTSTTTGTAASSGFNDATVPAGSYIRLTTSALTDATRLQIRITYTED